MTKLFIEHLEDLNFLIGDLEGRAEVMRDDDDTEELPAVEGAITALNTLQDKAMGEVELVLSTDEEEQVSVSIENCLDLYDEFLVRIIAAQ